MIHATMTRLMRKRLALLTLLRPLLGRWAGCRSYATRRLYLHHRVVDVRFSGPQVTISFRLRLAGRKRQHGRTCQGLEDRPLRFWHLRPCRICPGDEARMLRGGPAYAP